MGSYKFRLSEMIPNSWFHKLKDMGKAKESNGKKKSKSQKQKASSQGSYPRKSYYHSREPQSNEQDIEKESAKVKTRRRRSTARSPKRVVPSECSTIIVGEESAPFQELFPPEFRADGLLETQGYHPGEVVIRVDNESLAAEPKLSPIVTKQGRRKKKSEERHKSSPTLSPGGIRLRTHSPRISTRRSFHHNAQQSSSASCSTSGPRKSIYGSSLAIVKSSRNPQEDFRGSMLEMIAENKLTSTKDLEDLLACYLSLNSDDYHAMIIQVFKEIWFDLTDPTLHL